MSDIAIQVEDLWKQYRIGQKKSTSLRESMGHWFSKSEEDYFWALKELNFEVKRGEAVGIIGKNGAGKSTLLKVLSKITYPTKGRVTIHGRVSSLLEVGTGFHPELTGRQNVFLNGTILGMTRQEINAKFDEIVAFSGVEKFIDTAVKHYSSGMKVRLAFSVAAHLEPEILIIDEVLAVGDAEFQKKCLGKMEAVTGEGRTVLFVSHNMVAVEKLCKRIITLKEGSVNENGFDVLSIIGNYLAEGNQNSERSGNCVWTNSGNSDFDNDFHTFKSVELCEGDKPLARVIPSSVSINVRLFLKIKRFDPSLNIGYAVYRNREILFWSWMKDTPESISSFEENSEVSIQTAIPSGFLTKGEYVLEVFSVLDNIKVLIKKGEGIRISFEIEGSYSDIKMQPKFKWSSI